MEADRNRIVKLSEYVRGIMTGEDGKELYRKYRSDIEKVAPQEVFEIFYGLLQGGPQPKDILVFLDKVINVFYKSLVDYPWEKPGQDSFMGFLMQENRALVSRLDSIKEILREKDLEIRKKQLLPKVRELMEFRQHYVKKENILFPFLEKKQDKFNGLAIMWALHDETRALLKKVIECLESEDCSEAELNTELGKLFFAMYGLVKKEELILFPAASEIIAENEWKEMQRQSLEYQFPFIERPEQGVENEHTADFKEGYMLKTETGTLDLESILMIFDALPVDLTFVDENNKVRFYSRPKDRIFPRSPAIIGRSVENCHPPESVHKVNEILEAFRAGHRDNATFWIELKGRKILIKYFALRDSGGSYRGVLEVSQDITELTKLEGESRLLDWEK